MLSAMALRHLEQALVELAGQPVLEQALARYIAQRGRSAVPADLVRYFDSIGARSSPLAREKLDTSTVPPHAPLMTFEQAAGELGQSVYWVRRHVKAAGIVKVGRKLRRVDVVSLGGLA